MKIANGLIRRIVDVMDKPEFLEGATGETGFALYRDKRILSAEVADFDKMRDELIIKYGEQDEENGNYFIDTSDPESENYKNFMKELNSLSTIVLDVSGLYHVAKDKVDLPYCESATPLDYELLELVLTYSDEGEKENSENPKSKESAGSGEVVA